MCKVYILNFWSDESLTWPRPNDRQFGHTDIPDHIHRPGVSGILDREGFGEFSRP